MLKNTYFISVLVSWSRRCWMHRMLKLRKMVLVRRKSPTGARFVWLCESDVDDKRALDNEKLSKKFCKTITGELWVGEPSESVRRTGLRVVHVGRDERCKMNDEWVIASGWWWAWRWDWRWAWRRCVLMATFERKLNACIVRRRWTAEEEHRLGKQMCQWTRNEEWRSETGRAKNHFGSFRNFFRKSITEEDVDALSSCARFDDDASVFLRFHSWCKYLSKMLVFSFLITVCESKSKWSDGQRESG